MNSRSTSPPSALVTGDLKREFLDQQTTLRQSIMGPMGPDLEIIEMERFREITQSLENHVQELLEKYMGLSSVQAEALTRLITKEQVQTPSSDLIEEWIERTALLRSILALGLGEQVKTYFVAAARGAIEGFSLDGKSLITPVEMEGLEIPALTFKKSNSEQDLEKKPGRGEV